MVDRQSARGTRAASVCYVRERVSQESAGWHLRPPGDRRGLVGSHAGKVFAPPERGPVMPLGDDLGPSRRAAASQWQQDQTSAAVSAWLLGGDQATVAAASGPGTLLRRMLLWSLQVARGLSGQERGGPARWRAAHAFVALMEPAQRVDGISFSLPTNPRSRRRRGSQEAGWMDCVL